MNQPLIKTGVPKLCTFVNRKFISLLVIIGLIFVNVTYAQTTNPTITLQLKNVKRSEALQAVRKQTTLQFFYSIDALDKYPRISISVKSQPLNKVLAQILEGTKMSMVIEKDVVVLKENQLVTTNGQPELKKITVKGHVTNAEGLPLTGAAIQEVGTGNGTVTNENGDYDLTIQTIGAIKISYIGTRAVTIPIKAIGAAGLTHNVQLQNEVVEMNALVVTGYQNLSKRDVTGAVSTVKAEDIKIAGVNSIDKLLQGQIPGVAVTAPSGIVGVKNKVRTRGTSTLLGSQDPVWVVDGIIQNDPIPFEYTTFNALATGATAAESSDAIKNLIGNTVSFLNVEDIQDITVLKDASATAIYGVKAGNGVIVITTKRGKPGRTVINYATNITASEKPNYGMFNLMNSKERIDVSREIYDRGLQFQSTPDPISYEGLLKKLFDKVITQNQFNQEVNKLETMNTNWFDIFYRTPISSTHSLSFSGGSDKSTFYASVGMANNIGSSIGNDMKRYNANLRINNTISDKLKIGYNMNANTSTTNGFYQFDPFRYAYNTSRALQVYNSDGSPYYYVNNNSTNSGATITPFLLNGENERNTTGTTNALTMAAIGGDLEYKITKNLTFQSLANYSMMFTDGESYASQKSSYITTKRGFEFGTVLPGTANYNASGLPIGGVLNVVDVTTKSYTFRNTLNYVKKLFNNRDNLTAMAGVEARSLRYTGNTSTTYGYLPDRGKSFAQIPLTTISAATGGAFNNGLYSEMIPAITDRISNYLSYFGTVAYNFNQKYVFNASIRTDASNRFGQDANHRFLPVWSAGGKWNIAEENFLKNVSWLNQFSIRATYGFQGNVAENFSPDLIAQIPTGSSSTNTITGEAILKIKSLAYKDLRWEKNSTANLGLDFAFFNNRFSGSVDYYYKKTVDAIVQLPLPYEYGLLTMPINAGTIVNKGYEIVLNFAPIRSKDFNWNIRFNTAKNFNQVQEAGLTSATLWNLATSGSLYKSGTPVSGFWAFSFAGLDAKGLPTFNNLAKDNVAKTTDATLSMTYAGQIDPKFTGGLGNNFSYKNFSLNVFFNISLGNNKFLSPLFQNMLNSAPYPAANLQKDLVNRWRKPGDEKTTNIPSIPTTNLAQVPVAFSATSYSAYQLYDYSTIRVVNASFVRCQNIALNYRLPEGLLKHSRYIKQCSLQGSVTNLFYIASKNLQGIDPEVVGNSLPIPRNFSLTLNVGF